jgi:lipopolysaccharide transport system ATP-binding protein
MSRPIILVEELSKAYQIGIAVDRFPTFREAIVGALKSPWHRIRERGSNGSKDDETFWALKDVSFEVQPGEVVGIIGRNGAGKSTLLKILSRITEPTAGCIHLRGRVASLLEVGTGFHPELTGRENIYLNGSILGMKKAEIDRKFDEIVAFAEIEKFLDTPVKRYSSGMYVRLAFAVAAHLEPEILMVDEVLAVGDFEFQKKCLGKMQDVASEQGRTVLFVSHNLTAVRSLCTQVLWLERGMVEMDGSVAAAVDSYLLGMIGESRWSFDLERYDRQGASSGNGHLRLRSLLFNQGTAIRHGEPLEIKLTYEAFGDIEEAGFGVGFCSSDGGRIVTLDSDCPGPRYKIKKGSVGLIELSIDKFYLQPGRYFLDVAARSGDRFSLDYLPGFAQVDILPGPSTPTLIVGCNDTGGIRAPAKVRLRDLTIAGSDLVSDLAGA